MSQRVDTSSFPVGINISYDQPEDIADMAGFRADAWAFMNSWRWTPPIQDLVLAFGLGGVLGLFLVQFGPGGKPEDAERWVLVGDGPSMHFEADTHPTPELALRLYCATAQDWAGLRAGRPRPVLELPDPRGTDPRARPHAVEPGGVHS